MGGGKNISLVFGGASDFDELESSNREEMLRLFCERPTGPVLSPCWAGSALKFVPPLNTGTCHPSESTNIGSLFFLLCWVLVGFFCFWFFGFLDIDFAWILHPEGRFLVNAGKSMELILSFFRALLGDFAMEIQFSFFTRAVFGIGRLYAFRGGHGSAFLGGDRIRRLFSSDPLHGLRTTLRLFRGGKPLWGDFGSRTICGWLCSMFMSTEGSACELGPTRPRGLGLMSGFGFDLHNPLQLKQVNSESGTFSSIQSRWKENLHNLHTTLP